MAARAAHLQYKTLQEFYNNLTVDERAQVAKTTRSKPVHNLLQNDRASKVRAALILNPAYKFSSLLDSVDYSSDSIPKTVLDWVEMYGSASVVKQLLKNPQVSNHLKKKLKPVHPSSPSTPVTEPVMGQVKKLGRKEQLDLLHTATPESLAVLVYAPETGNDILYRIALTPHQGLKRVLAERTDLETPVMKTLVETGDIETCRVLASRKYLTDAVFWDLYHRGEPGGWDENSLWWVLAENFTTPEELLKELFNRTTPWLWTYGFRKADTAAFHSVLLQHRKFPADIMLTIIKNRQKDLIEMLIPNPVFTEKDRAELKQLLV